MGHLASASGNTADNLQDVDASRPRRALNPNARNFSLTTNQSPDNNRRYQKKTYNNAQHTQENKGQQGSGKDINNDGEGNSQHQRQQKHIRKDRQGHQKIWKPRVASSSTQHVDEQQQQNATTSSSVSHQITQDAVHTCDHHHQHSHEHEHSQHAHTDVHHSHAQPGPTRNRTIRKREINTNRRQGSEAAQVPHSNNNGREGSRGSRQRRNPQHSNGSSSNIENTSSSSEPLKFGAFSRIKPKHSSDHAHNSKSAKSSKPSFSEFVGESLGEFPELTVKIIEDFENDRYECMVCFDVIKRHVAVWSCSTCYAVFHLYCINQWIKNLQAVTLNSPIWRCPGCQHEYSKEQKPKKYLCFCGKQRDPDVDKAESFVLPHSCGDTCGKMRKGTPCPHPCVVPCHPGPCPSCTTMRTIDCFCGKAKFSIKCSNVATHQSCGNICGKMLSCSMHTCPDVCHDGPCKPCAKVFAQTCYCGKVTEEKVCSTESRLLLTDEEYVTDLPKIRRIASLNAGVDLRSFTCSGICNQVLDCGNHFCQSVCHPSACADCPRVPGRVKTCPCGKTNIDTLQAASGKVRNSCLDPIPTCTKICGKLLPCQKHYCKSVCHEGECPDCDVTVEVFCRCGSTSRKLPCHTTYKPSPDVTLPLTCNTVCKASKSCGKHKCKNVCCPAYRDLSMNSVHECNLICNRLLSCGTHRCELTCHKGPCHYCYQTITTEVTCRCGKTELLPPQPCGTQPPECNFECSIKRECGHEVGHRCHPNPPCPPCTVVVEKLCNGGHTKMRALCHVTNVSCGKKCGKILCCKRHLCERTCHTGPCTESANANNNSNNVKGGKGKGKATANNVEPCGYPCGALLPCGHDCKRACHPFNPCNADACKEKVKIFCQCKRIEKAIECRNFKKLVAEYDGDADKVTNRTFMECDDECRRIERLLNLAEALHIKDPNRESVFNSDSPFYTEEIIALGRKYPNFLQIIEDNLAKFIGDRNSVTLRFEPVSKEKRHLTYGVAEQYKLQCYALDPEPNRRVVCDKTAYSRIPPVLLSECIKNPSKTPLAPSQPSLEADSANSAISDAPKAKGKARRAPMEVDDFNWDSIPVSQPKNFDELENAAAEEKNMDKMVKMQRKLGDDKDIQQTNMWDFLSDESL